MKELTKAEEQIMQILWQIEKGFVNDVLNNLPDPKPAYNTVSTVIRILEQKGFVGHKAYGKTHEYFPLVTKSDYTVSLMSGVMKNYFGGSFKQMVSFFADGNNISLSELDEVKKTIEEQIKKR